MKAEKSDDLKLYTSSEIANILKMNPQVIARKLQAGDLEGYKIGKDWRVSHEQLLRFLGKHANTSATKSPQEKVIKSFFKDGKLKSIPTTRSKRDFVLRFMVSKLEPNRVYSEKEINDFISEFHQDFCTLRRELVNSKLMIRSAGKYKVVSWTLRVIVFGMVSVRAKISRFIHRKLTPCG